MDKSLYVSDIFDEKVIGRKDLNKDELFDLSFNTILNNSADTRFNKEGIRLMLSFSKGLILKFDYADKYFYVKDFIFLIEKVDGNYEFNFTLSIPEFADSEIEIELGIFESDKGHREFYFNDFSYYKEGKTLLERAKEYLIYDIFNNYGVIFSIFSLKDKNRILTDDNFIIDNNDIDEIYSLKNIDNVFREVTNEKEIKEYLVQKGFR
ncbi:hypothetical protein UFVDC4_00033 [Staphylococcus phage vB_SauM-UFV_DC4]|nr:hypothetical protein UFVDC4_00033 [Staphylococcus phage vB_SauM-UFV_DC4]